MFDPCLGDADTGGSCKPPQRLDLNFNGKRQAKTLIAGKNESPIAGEKAKDKGDMPEKTTRSG